MTRQKSFNTRHSIEEKLSLIRRYDSGTTLKELSEERGIHSTQIKDWVSRFRACGIDGLHLNNRNYTPSLKAEVVSKILDKGLSLRQVSIDYRIERGVIRRWIKKVDAEGIDSLSIDNRGRSKNMDKKPRKPQRPLSREQELLNENERLQAEVAYLKKLRALVEERVARESGIGRKPSKD